MSNEQFQILVACCCAVQAVTNWILYRKSDLNAQAVVLLEEIVQEQTVIIKAHQKKFDEAIECP